MNYRDTAVEALEDARQSLRDVMGKAVAAEAFADVAAIANAAESLAVITKTLRVPDAQTPAPAKSSESDRASERATVISISSGETVTTPATRQIATVQREQYPQYFREADRLIKRAWSPKERQPYEHKAPREIVDVLLEAIQQRKGHHRPFEAADLLPLMKGNGEEYPSYQSYLALGWLRQAGAIAKGREGYLLRPGWNRERVAAAWDTLPSVA